MWNRDRAFQLNKYLLVVMKILSCSTTWSKILFLRLPFVFLLSSYAALAQVDTTQQVVPGRLNSLEQQQKPYVILISADGFGYDYAEKFQARNLLALREQGVQAASLIPSFPSKTFPNHYTIATGLYPAHHGLLNNSFYDPQRQKRYAAGDREMVEDPAWYGGTPLWVLAEQQQMLTACFYWVGSEAPIQGVYPTYRYNYNEQIPLQKRFKVVLDWLSLPDAKRPHLISLYLPEVDKAGHTYGPDAAETKRAVQELDQQLKVLVDAVSTTGLPVNFIFLSDHGMVGIDQENVIRLPAAVDTAETIVSGGDVLVELHLKEKKKIKPTFVALESEAAGYKAYLKRALPKHLHYNRRNDRYNRLGDILLVAEAPAVFHFRDTKPNPGTHGYDPSIVKEMHATFYAWGPAFNQGQKVPAFENIHVYPLVAELLQLAYRHRIDGKSKVAKQILYKYKL